MSKIKSKITNKFPGIYHIEYKSYFDMGMSFLKMQEFYESSSKEFLGKFFDEFEFMRYYTQEYKKDSFTYTEDYVGYNIPSYVIDKFRDKKKNFNIFEKDLFKKINTIKEKKFYLIASKDGSKSVLKHELAHGFYYLNKNYKKEVLEIIETIPKNKKEKIFKEFKKMGYGASVHEDELQAYYSTGLTDKLNKIGGMDKYKKQFKKVFKKYYKDAR